MPDALPDLFHADGVLFDLDGVLTPTAEVHMRAWKAVFDDVFARWDITPPYTDEDYFAYVAVVEALHAAGIPLGVVSSSKNAEEVLAAAGIRSFFRVVIDGVVAEREHLASKPAADMFAAGASALGVNPARSIAVEDATSGAASAAAAGYAVVIGVDRGAGADALRAAGATHVVDDLGILLPAARTDTPETA